MFGSCENESSDINHESNEFFVSQDELFSLLEQPQSTSSRNTNSTKNKLEKIQPLIDDESKEVLMYVANYSDKGFMIVAADKRIEPILAYSFENTFDLSDEIDQGLASWFESKVDYIKFIKKNVKEPTAEITLQWTAFGRIPEHFENPTNNCDFILNENYSYGPLLQTEWGQGVGFNNEMPIPTGVFVCQIGILPEERYFAGCVPVAIAQIARSYQFPLNYTWASMNDSTGGAETSRFIKYIHDNIPISYTCEGTSVSTNVDKAAFFKNKLGYSTAINANWSDNLVIANLSANKPVFVEAGSTKKNILGFKVRGTGHAWVCDGVKSYMACYQDEYGKYYGMGGRSFYMNWGWGGYRNGYYATGNFNPTGTAYNFEPKIVYNINP